MLDELFKQFIREQQYLKGVAPATVEHYQNAWIAFRKAFKDDEVTATLPVDFIAFWKDSGTKHVSINTYARPINTFLNWLHAQGKCAKTRIPKLKEENPSYKPFDEKTLRKILLFKPKATWEKRLHVILCLIMDTGLRIDEALRLERTDIDFDNLLISVLGKGQKHRVVPYSHELRKLLFKHTITHKHKLVFCTRHGSKIIYSNVRRDWVNLSKRLGVEITSFHALRHNYALNHIRQGGDIFSLQRLLGHSDLETTKIYVHLTTEDLSIVHKKTSILSRLR